MIGAQGRGCSYCNANGNLQYVVPQKLLLMISDLAGREEYKKPEPNPALPLLGGKKLR